MSLSQASTQKPRVAFLNTHPIQYFAPLYAYLNASGEASVSAFYLSDYSLRGSTDKAFGREVRWDIDLLAGYEARFSKGYERRNQMNGFFSAVAPALWHELRMARLDVLIVHGHTPAAMLLGALAAKSVGTAVYMRGETHLGLRRSKLKSPLRRPLLTMLYAQLDGAFAIGSANAQFYRAMGIPETRIFPMPYTVDNARFAKAAHIAPSRRNELREALGVTDTRPIVLYAAKFQKRKRPDDLIRAVSRLKLEGLNFHVALVGSGEMEDALRRLAAELGVTNISFVGFVNQSAMPELYAACDVFVLPSDNEPWGLAVNEAMCAGLPVVLSREIGCVPDLLREGRNGFSFPAGDDVALAAGLRALIAQPDECRRMGDESRKIIADWSYAECLVGLKLALEQSRRTRRCSDIGQSSA